MRFILQVFLRLALAGFVIIVSHASFAQCTFKTLSIPGSTSSGAAGINDKGAIVGEFIDSSSKSHGYFLFNGRFAKFSFPGAISTEALDINNSAVIVGDYTTSSGAQHGFMVLNGVFHSISAPGPSGTQTRAIGINNFGTIVGAADSSAGQNGFVLHGSRFTTVHFPGSARSLASGINDSGVIVGTYALADGVNHGFVLKNGVYKAANFPGADNTSLTRVDNAGELVGIYTLHGDTHGFSFANGKFTTIDAPNASLATIIFGVNSFDRIVGSFIGVPATNKSFIADCASVF